MYLVLFYLTLLAVEENDVLYCIEHKLFQVAIVFLNSLYIDNVIMDGYSASVSLCYFVHLNLEHILGHAWSKWYLIELKVA